MDMTDEQRAMYDAEAWAWVVRKAGLEPYRTETQAREVARVAAVLISEAFEAGWDAHCECLDTATSDIPFEHVRNQYLDAALGEEES
jgi:hypothetical protein